MFYKNNSSERLDMNLFKNPPREYRGAPFWAWNCELEKDMLLKQIDYLKEMGFGGFNMHSRAGMATEYLSDEFMCLVKACRDKAEKEHMLAWVYDEDRWPSGFAGGYVTKTKKFRHKTLMFSEHKVDFVSKERGTQEGKPYLLAVFDITLNSDGTLKNYKMIGENEKAEGIKRYAYVKTSDESGMWNNQTYVDALSEEAIQEFIEITYECYKKNVGKSFGKTIPAIFTDEPQLSYKKVLSFAQSHEDVEIPWTTDFDKTYMKMYHDDIISKIPEIFWDLPNGKISVSRYRYHDHICERFTQNYADRCGKWCEKNGIALTGHMLSEQTLWSQTQATGEVMRAYRSLGIPGIDMLCDNIEITTAKQTQSAVHQYGREAMLSELYGVTGWGFDFRGHKFQGDWQAALGVTIRVPHLSWVSMKGCAKRDYPATFNYQVPWYKEYPYVEDHYARLNTVLTRGKPIVDVAVIHPIESYWLHWGPSDSCFDIRSQIEENFQNLAKWLITGMVDFDYISEALLPQQVGEITDRLTVGEMKYKTIIVAGCETIRKTTLDILNNFKENGGRVIFIGECPTHIDAVRSNGILPLYGNCEKVNFDRNEIIDLLNEERTAEILDKNGEKVRNLVQNYRQDGNIKWLFLAHIEKTETPDVPKAENLTIVLNGSYMPKIYNTINGSVEDAEFETKNGKTYIYKRIYAHDSILLRLENGEGSNISKKSTDKTWYKTIDFKNNVEYKRDEDNVLLLDMAEYSLDGDAFKSKEELIVIDDKCRNILGFPRANGTDTQPWVRGKEVIEHYVVLRFKVSSVEEIENTYIAAEEAEQIIFNGEKISLEPIGYYVDESIIKYKLGKLKKGVNVIEVQVPIGKRTSVENMFLLGDFDVYVRGCETFITKPSEKIGFADISKQGLAFYGGNISYKATFKLEKESDIQIRASRYRGATMKVYVDDKDAGMICYAPYILDVDKLKKGIHTVEFKVYGNRENTFGPLHSCSYDKWYGPKRWYDYEKNKNVSDEALQGTEWTYEYNLKPQGLLSSPVIYVY